MRRTPDSRRQRNLSLSRRTFLRGVGVTMALPWLESLAAVSASAAPTEAGMSAAFPKRFAVLFMGCGVNPDHWSAKGDGAAMELSKTLAPLEPLKGKINVINGLFNKRATGQGIHPRRPAICFPECPLQKAPSSTPGSAWTR